MSAAHRRRKFSQRKLERQVQTVGPVQLELACDTDASAVTRSPVHQLKV